MKTETIIEYVAIDGQRFREAAHCEQHEREIAELAPIVSRIPDSRIDAIIALLPKEEE